MEKSKQQVKLIEDNNNIQPESGKVRFVGVMQINMIKLDSPPEATPVNHVAGRPVNSHTTVSCMRVGINSGYFQWLRTTTGVVRRTRQRTLGASISVMEATTTTTIRRTTTMCVVSGD
jgi:hypothetical protein